MKIKITHEEGDTSLLYDSVVFSKSVDSVEDWSTVLDRIAELSIWAKPMLLLEAALDADLSDMHYGWWADENKERLEQLRNELTRVLERIAENYNASKTQ